MLTTPTPTTEGGDRQRHQALAAANGHRSAAAQLKRQLRSGTITLRQILADPPDAIASQITLDVLGWAPGVGRSRLQTLNIRTGHFNVAAPLGSLTDRQRRWLAGQITGRR